MSSSVVLVTSSLTAGLARELPTRLVGGDLQVHVAVTSSKMYSRSCKMVSTLAPRNSPKLPPRVAVVSAKKRKSRFLVVRLGISEKLLADELIFTQYYENKKRSICIGLWFIHIPLAAHRSN